MAHRHFQKSPSLLTEGGSTASPTSMRRRVCRARDRWEMPIMKPPCPLGSATGTSPAEAPPCHVGLYVRIRSSLLLGRGLQRPQSPVSSGRVPGCANETQAHSTWLWCGRSDLRPQAGRTASTRSQPIPTEEGEIPADTYQPGSHSDDVGQEEGPCVPCWLRGQEAQVLACPLLEVASSRPVDKFSYLESAMHMTSGQLVSLKPVGPLCASH